MYMYYIYIYIYIYTYTYTYTYTSVGPGPLDGADGASSALSGVHPPPLTEGGEGRGGCLQIVQDHSVFSDW